jgi:mannose-6-phosphate isomerase-like protein (cupin superfamily)
MTEQQTRPVQPLVVGPGDGRELPLIGRVALSGAQTGGAFELIDFRGNAACPPPHIHREREECIQVLEGLFTFSIGTEDIQVAPGSWVYVPRGTRHGFTASDDARALILVTPAGLEGFFAALGGGLAAGTPTHELRAALKGRFDSVPA